MPATRTGKIARAPFEVRTRVNEMLRDGATAAAVIRFLESKDVFGVNETNVANWRAGGHQDWLLEQDRLADMAAKREFALAVVRENQGSKLHEATLHLAASQLYETLTEFDLTALKELLKAKPENYSAIVNSLARLSKGSLDREKFEFDAAAACLEKLPELQAVATQSKMSAADKQKAIRQILFQEAAP